MYFGLWHALVTNGDRFFINSFSQSLHISPEGFEWKAPDKRTKTHPGSMQSGKLNGIYHMQYNRILDNVIIPLHK